MGCFACFDGGKQQRKKEEDRLAPQEARAKAAEAAEKRHGSSCVKCQLECQIAQDAHETRTCTIATVNSLYAWTDEQFDKSAAGRAAHAQLAAAAKQAANTNKGEPVLKMG